MGPHFVDYVKIFRRSDLDFSRFQNGVLKLQNDDNPFIMILGEKLSKLGPEKQ